ncbi:hypothetical protein [Luteipulveratus halotolerans]|nr:hypothetical protein [Luteipulveratus halotolerans]
MYQVLNEQLARQRVHPRNTGVRRRSLQVALHVRRQERHRLER